MQRSKITFVLFLVLGQRSLEKVAANQCLSKSEMKDELRRFEEEANAFENNIIEKVLSGFGQSVSTRFRHEEPMKSFLLKYIVETHMELRESISKNIENRIYPTDCSDIWALGGRPKSGLYDIFPIRNQLKKSLEVFCDMEDGGGWTVFLLRNAASKHVEFNRNWEDYKEFFGNADQEYWIGIENLHGLTSHRNYEVKWEAKDGEGRSTWEGYESFSVASEENGYRLNLGGRDQRSTVEGGLGFGDNYGQKFSTYDNDNDVVVFNCAERSKGGWWYKWCSYIFPTGIHGKKGGVWMQQWSKEDRSERYPTWLQFKMRPTN